jgi:phosphoglycerate dehydrogenase-like enzyme
VSDPVSDPVSGPVSDAGSDTVSDTIISGMSVAVASHSFPKHETLRRELEARYPAAVYNQTGRPLVGDDLIRFLRGHEKAITGLEVLDEAVFAAVPELRIVSKYGVGLDMIDLAAASRCGVSVRWTHGVNRQAVAELAIAFMLVLGRSTVTLARELRDGGWRQPGGRQLSSASVGIVGCGDIGRQVARLAVAFGARILAHDIRVYDDFYREVGVTALSLDALLAEADFVTVHVPLDPSTRGLIGAREIARMKRSAFLVNTARGGIVNEAALKAALIEGRLAGAACDVFAIEPPLDRELLLLSNFVGTPHIGGSTVEAALAMGRAAITGLDDPARQIS